MTEESANAIQRCPCCRYSGGMDGMGDEVKEYDAIDKDGVKKTIVETRFQAHCPGCDVEFLVVEDKHER